MALHHVNFHTLLGKPIFEQDVYDQMMRGCIRSVLRERTILCLAWELMPTHLHLIVEDFDDYPRGTMLKHFKGDTSAAFFRAFPETRADLLGGHLWSKGYYAARIISHRQFLVTLDYVRNNRLKAGLPPPAPLEPVGIG